MESGEGGEVDKMIEKWLVERDATSDQFRARSFEQGGPPPFIPFEKRRKTFQNVIYVRNNNIIRNFR